MGTFSAFKTMLIVQLFWALSVTMIASTLPVAQAAFVANYTSSEAAGIMNEIGPQMETNLTDQLNVPLLDVGALIFYSGNLLVDLLLNFFTAIPQMFTLLVDGMFMFFPIDAALENSVKLFVGTIITVLYIMGLFNILTGLRSGTVGIA